jgi:hypothetical protein
MYFDGHITPNTIVVFGHTVITPLQFIIDVMAWGPQYIVQVVHTADCGVMCCAAAAVCCAVLCCLPLQPVVLESATEEPGYTTISSAPAAVLGGINAAAARAIWLEDHLADVSGVVCGAGVNVCVCVCGGGIGGGGRLLGGV